MKKSIKKAGVIFMIALFTASFTTTVKERKDVKVSESTVVWKGYKVTGSHEGTVAIKSGSLIFEVAVLTGGEFVIDMTTLNTTDLEGSYKNKLDGHLKSDDFFGVDAHPEASLVFTKVNATSNNTYQIMGDLTIKGKTNTVSFTMTVSDNKASASLKINRTDYDVRYASASFFDGLKDRAIYDDFDLAVKLEF